MYKHYATRYQARKAARNNEVAVKVCGGGDTVTYILMPANQYRAWRKQH